MDPATLQTQMRATLSDGPSGEEITCPCMWDEILNVSISLVIPSHTAGVFVVPALDNFVPGESGVHTLGAVLFPGSNLIGGFTWTRRDLLRPPSSFALAGEYATTTVYTPDIIGLQDIPGSAMAAGAAALKLYQLSPWLTRVLQDTLDTTALTGVGTFGGVWTFLNGAFAFLFGANVFYFLLRRRPLSALGVLHIFQRRRLVRQWHEDFPAIHTEGGRPGSNSAGIVVFIRERLVDLDEEIEAGDDIEAQFPKGEEIITTDTAMPNLDISWTPYLYSMQTLEWGLS
ncbi:hypothetical protein DFH06DRAFT_1344745 [Mycena polygramma]|nr:hypothetical protein DFH06DRAFT_1344745 [Mycena polygramma]